MMTMGRKVGARRRGPRAPEVIRSLVQSVINASGRPVSRNELSARISEHLATSHGLSWSRATITREVRRAIGELEQEGVPIVSDGTGFRIATTAAERAAAALKLERMGLSCLRRAAAIRRLELAHEAQQLSLFEGEASS